MAKGIIHQLVDGALSGDELTLTFGFNAIADKGKTFGTNFEITVPVDATKEQIRAAMLDGAVATAKTYGVTITNSDIIHIEFDKGQ